MAQKEYLPYSSLELPLLFLTIFNTKLGLDQLNSDIQDSLGDLVIECETIWPNDKINTDIFGLKIIKN